MGLRKRLGERAWLALRRAAAAYELRQTRPPDAAVQVQLRLAYQTLAAARGPWPSLAEVGFQAFSQADEDGILLYLFALIGASERTCVEICAGDGRECNTANLIINHGWTGLLVDGDARLVERGRRFYREHSHTRIAPPTFVHAWVTRDGVNHLVRSAGFSGEIDLLSLDLDGVDYWIWQALDVVQPRVVVVEYQDILGAERSVTVPYADDFDATRHPMSDGMPNYCGASLPAFVKLARSRGYRLVGCNRYGYNAFFVRDALASDALPEVPVHACLRHRRSQDGMRDRYPTVAHLPWVEV